MSVKADSTRAVDADGELQRTTRLLETLLTIESEILRAETPKAIADVALKNLQRIIPCSVAIVNLFQLNYTEAVILTGINLPFEPGRRVPVSANIIEARHDGEPLLVNDLAVIEDRSAGLQLAFELGGRTLLSVPLLAHGELLGIMTLVDKAPAAFAEEETALAQKVGNSVAIAIYNAHLLEMERKARQVADTLRDVAGIISAGMGQKELLELILEELERVLAYDRASILLNEGEQFAVAASRGRELQSPKVVFRSDTAPHFIGRVIAEKRPLLVTATRDEPNWHPGRGTEFVGSWLGIPLTTKDNLLGLLLLGKEEPYYYSEEDKSLAVAFANHAVIAIENASLYREIRQYATGLETQVADRTRDLAALYEISAIAGRHLELDETLDQIITVIIETLGCSAASIHVLDTPNATLHLVAHRNLAPSMLAYLQKLPVSHPQMSQILEKKDTLIYTTGSLEELSDVPLPDTFAHGVSTAIRAKGEDLGILGVGYDNRGEPPTREDVALITSIADNIGVAIENARLREQSRRLAVLNERERLAQELHDSATQSMFTLTLFAGAAREHLAAGEYKAVREQLVELEETAVQTHKEMRLLLYELRPDILAEEGLEEALRQRMQMVESRSGIRGQIRADVSITLPPSAQEALFAVANEALNNALKHAGATEVTIEIQAEDGQIEMCISDNGRGFSPIDGTFTIGMGMNSMRQRLAEIQGTLHYESERQEGTRVIARVPLEVLDVQS